jgi:hypothetical protein
MQCNAIGRSGFRDAVGVDNCSAVLNVLTVLDLYSTSESHG